MLATEGVFMRPCAPPLTLSPPSTICRLPSVDLTLLAGLNVLLGGKGPVLTPLFGGEKNISSSIFINPGVIGELESTLNISILLPILLDANGCVGGNDALGNGIGCCKTGIGR